MSASRREDRTRLDGFELEIFKLVRKRSTFEQWREWLRVPLEHAAAEGNMDLFTRLVDAGCSRSAGWRGCGGRTLLGAAARGKSEEMVVALLRAGAKGDVNVRFGTRWNSALHVAATHGAEGASRALMFAGADTNLPNRKKNTPLHLAAELGHDGVVSDLFVKGADLNAKNDQRQTPLHVAARSGRVSCVSELLLAGAEKDQRNRWGETPLFLAAEDGQAEVVEQLLAAKANPHIVSNNDYSPLGIAAMSGNSDALRALLRHGGDIEACDEDGLTTLHYAAENLAYPDRDNSGAVRVLLEAGANTEAKSDEFRSTPLFLALGRVGTMCALLEGGANVNAHDIDGGTPLHCACRGSQVDAVELLLHWGADETLEDYDGLTAAEDVGKWADSDDEDSDVGNRADVDEEEKRWARDQRIRRMLARAPADRSWRRRGWLVLARSRPARVQLAQDTSASGGRSAKVVKAGCDRSGVGDGAAGPQAPDLACLVGSVVGLDAEVVFRIIVGFL